jgi:hypothetical protein
MLTNLKRILLTQYIGAIITAYVAVQGLLSLIGVVGLAIAVVMEPRQTGVLAPFSERAGLNWDRVLTDLTRALLHFAAAGGLIYWLYVDKERPIADESQIEEPPTDPVEP